MSSAGQLVIREANADDATTVHALIARMAASIPAAIGFVSTPADFEQALASEPPAVHALLAEDGVEAVGVLAFFLTFSTWRGSRGVYVQDIYVDAAARGKGIGNRLLAAVCRWGMDRGADHLRLSVDRTNLAAQSFYDDRAFTACDEERIYMIADEAFRQLGTRP